MGLDANESAPDSDKFSRPVEINILYTAINRKLFNEPSKIALNLSKSGAKIAHFVSSGHTVSLPHLDPKLMFEVVIVKPKCAYIELRTVSNQPHNLAEQDLRLGGVLRVQVGGSRLEECAVLVLRGMKARPKAGLKLTTLVDAMHTQFGIHGPGSAGGKIPLWLEQCHTLTTSFSELREDWLVKCPPRQTLLERTTALLLAPGQHGSVDRGHIVCDDLLKKLAEVSPDLIGPPLSDVTMLRRWLDASPFFELSGDEVALSMPMDTDRQHLTPLPNQSTLNCCPALVPRCEVRPNKNGAESSRWTGHANPHSLASNSTWGTTRSANIQSISCTRVLQVVDELRQLTGEALKLSRDKRRVVDDCIEGVAGRGDRVNGMPTMELLSVMRSTLAVVQRLDDELMVMIRDATVDVFKARSWQSGITSHAQQLRDVLVMLESADERAPTDLVQHITAFRHGLLDFEQKLLGGITAALSGMGEGIQAPQQPPPMNGGRRVFHRIRDACGYSKDARNGRNARGCREARGAAGDHRDSRESGRAWSRSRTDLQSCTLSSASREPKEIKLNVTDLYEVMSSEGTWYPATIRRLKRNGRYEADLYGGGCVVAYPSVKAQDIRLRRHWVDCPRNRSLHDSCSRNGSRHYSRSRSRCRAKRL